MSSNNLCKHVLNDGIKYNFIGILCLFSSFPYSSIFIFLFSLLEIMLPWHVIAHRPCPYL